MLALVSHSPGPASTLRLQEVPDPVAGPGQLLVRVHACGVNFTDALFIEDRYQVKLARPFSPGGEICGTVLALGAGVSGFAPGDKIIGRCSSGGMAQRLALAADRCVRVPADTPVLEAAAFLFTYATTWYALVDRAGLKPGETLLVLGAGGGLGIAATDLGRAFGARVVVAASSQAKVDHALAGGAQGGLVYPADLPDRAAQKALSESFKTLVGPDGANVVFDPVGGNYTEPALRATARDGRLLVLGFTAGIPRLPTNLVLLKVCQVVGVDWRDFTEQHPQRNAANIAALVALWQSGRISPRYSKIYPLAQAAEAIESLNSRQAVGKLVIAIDG